MSRNRQRLAAVALGLFLGLAGIEIGVRMFVLREFQQGVVISDSWAPCGRYDAELGWSNRPGARVRVVNPRFEYDVEINARGFRDRLDATDARQDADRILFLGDSMTWGWGVEQGERFTDLLGESLGPRAQVANMAVPGYGTDQELWTLTRRGWEFSPRIVVLGFVLNDVVDCQRKVRYRMYKPRYVRTAEGGWQLDNYPAPPPYGSMRMLAKQTGLLLRAHSATAAWLAGAAGYRNPIPEGTEVGTTLQDEPGTDAKSYVLATKVSREQIDGYCAAIADPDSVISMLLARLAEDCRAHGAELVVFSMPHNHDQHLYNPGATAPEGVSDGDESTLAVRIREAGARLGFTTVSIDQALRRETLKGVNLDCGDGHYNAAGNRVVADALRPTLEALLGERR